MEEPEFTQHPTELFGYPFTNLSSEAQTARNNQYCPFLDGECKKPRKSQPDVKVGTCTVGYKGNFLKKMTPIPLRTPAIYAMQQMKMLFTFARSGQCGMKVTMLGN